MDQDFARMTASALKEWFASVTGSEVNRVCGLLGADERKIAQVALSVLKECKRKEQAEKNRLETMYQYEREVWDSGVDLIAGVDEVGRGPLAGPVMAAAVILKPGTLIPGLNDSKQVAPHVRERLFDVIKARAVSIAVGLSDVHNIDKYNIAQASFAAMREALVALSVKPEFVLVDGFRIPGIDIPQRAIIKGDALSNSIAAASIIAKVTRDRLMADLHAKYPRYGFSENKGYSTKEHQAALIQYGPCPEHRRSFTRVMTAQLLLDGTRGQE